MMRARQTTPSRYYRNLAILFRMTTLPLALQPPDPRWRLRPVRMADIDALQTNCWLDRSFLSLYNLVSRAILLAKENNGLGVVFVDDENTVCGYGQLTTWPHCAEITDLVVAETYRSRGIGTTIIQYLMRVAREMQMDCVEIGAALDNPRALALYRRLGFEESHTLDLSIGVRKHEILYLRIDLNSQ
jgi:ribosomal protein S18 acetylase RimI-like enzyme